MTYTTQATPAAVMRILEENLFASRRNQSRFRTERWTDDEVILISHSGNGRVIITIRNGQLTISGSDNTKWIQDEVVSVLKRGRVQLDPIVTNPVKLERRFIIHDHMRTSCSPKRRSSTKDNLKIQTAHLMIDALHSVEKELGRWVVFSDEAWQSAAKYRYTDLDKVKSALKALAEAARINGEGRGLGMPWEAFMSLRGVSYSPNSSKTVRQRFSNQYSVSINGKRLLTEAHVCFGVGKPPHCARIYLRQPDKPGDPVIIGSVGPHLDIVSR